MSHYFDNVPETESSRRRVEYRVDGRNFIFATDTAVFCRDSVDRGTDLLINTVIDDIRSRGARRNERLLDLGCGWGAVGIVLNSVFTLFEITAVDINSRAVSLATENAKNNNVKLHKICVSNILDSLSEEEKFDIVVTNPPVRAGKKTVFEFYQQAYEHMADGAAIYVVLQRKQGAPSSRKRLEELFGNCEDIAISGGYHIMKSVREAHDGKREIS